MLPNIAPPDGLVSDILKFSVTSGVLSSTIGMVIGLLVSPLLKVRMPAVEV